MFKNVFARVKVGFHFENVELTGMQFFFSSNNSFARVAMFIQNIFQIALLSRLGRFCLQNKLALVSIFGGIKVYSSYRIPGPTRSFPTSKL